MSNSILKALALAIPCSLFTGCAKDSCAVDPHGKECADSVTDMAMKDKDRGILTISPRRLNIKGDMIAVTPSATTSAMDSVRITQAGAMDLELGKLGAGNLMLSGSMLKSLGFKPGKANLVIGTNAAEPIRFYLSPEYVRASPDISTGSTSPLWVGVSSYMANKNLVTLVDTGMGQPPGQFVQYKFPNGTTPFAGAKIFPLGTKTSMTPNHRFVGYPNASDNNLIKLQSCPAAADNCDEIQTATTEISDLTVNRNGTLLGVILGKNLVAYSVGSSFDTTTPMVPNTNVLNPKLLGSEDLDGDGLPDFVVWDDMAKSISALRQTNSGAGPSFVIDADLSSQLNKALGNDVPTALFVDDVDGDGWEDLIYTTRTNFGWVVNQGPGQDGKHTFMKGGMVAVSGSVDSLAVGDIDLDPLHKNDLTIASKSDKNIKIFINQATY